MLILWKDADWVQLERGPGEAWPNTKQAWSAACDRPPGDAADCFAWETPVRITFERGDHRCTVHFHPFIPPYQ